MVTRTIIHSRLNRQDRNLGFVGTAYLPGLAKQL